MSKGTIIAFQKGQRAFITRDFSSSEFDCRCTHLSCSTTLVSMELVTKLQIIRDQIGPLKINSGFRCGPHNAAEGGEPRSFHLLGMAADVRPLTAPLQALIECVEREFATGGIGKYVGRVHVDLRPFTARWTKVDKA